MILLCKDNQPLCMCLTIAAISFICPLHHFHSAGLKNGLQAYLSLHTGKTSWRADLILHAQGGSKNSAGGRRKLSSSATRKLLRALLCITAAISHSFHPASQLYVPDVAVGIWLFYSIKGDTVIHETMLSSRTMKPFDSIPCSCSQQSLQLGCTSWLPRCSHLPVHSFCFPDFLMVFKFQSTSVTYLNLYKQPLNRFPLGQSSPGDGQGMQTHHLLTTFNCSSSGGAHYCDSSNFTVCTRDT